MKRIGFLLANLNQGMSVSMWRGIADEAMKASGGPLFLFPGGRLDYRDNSEYLANSIYNMADNESLDGLIIWASSLAGNVSMEEAARFVKDKASVLPVVSIGLKVPGVPSVDFDAYSGLKAEVLHLAQEHGERKIAFLRGPENHKSAEVRYKAYLDALAESGIDVDPALVSSPQSWDEGAEAAEELVRARRLVPGRDFTSLVAASDQLLAKAYHYLRELGIRIPEDLKVAGFNDNDEDLGLLDTRVTTVRMPVRQLARTAYAFISGSEKATSFMLPAKLVVRSSCGCQESFPRAVHTKQGFFSELSGLLGSESAFEAARSILECFKSGEDGDLENYVQAFFQEGADIDVLLSAVPVYARLEGMDADPAKLDWLYRSLLAEEQRKEARDRLSSQQSLRFLNDFKTELISVHTLEQAVSVMASFFPRLGITKGFLFLYEGLSGTVFSGGFSGDGIISGGERFRKGALSCPSLDKELGHGVFIVEPLYQGAEELGYLILSTVKTEGHLLEDIRMSVSYAVKGIRLFEEMMKAKEDAERNEREAREFYRRISEGVIQPLREISSIARGQGSIDRGLILEHALSAERLLEFSIAERLQPGSLKVLCPLQEILSGLSAAGFEVESPEELPALCLDKDKVMEAFSIIGPEGRRRIKVSLKREGACFTVITEGQDAHAPSVVLAQKILMLHSGALTVSEEGIDIIFPYPALSGDDSPGLGDRRLVYIGEARSVPDSLMPLSPFAYDDKEDLKASGIAWRYEGEESVKALVRVLGRVKAGREQPFLCFGLVKAGTSIFESLESVFLPPEVTICCFCKVPPELSSLEELGDIARVSALRDLERLNTVPSLLLFDRLDYKLFKDIRERRRYSKVPMLLVQDSYTLSDAESLSLFPNLLMVNRSVLEAPAFLERLTGLIGGAPMLPALTGALVKKAIGYLNENAKNSVSRWKLADAVNVSEDYLTRIFHKETGISPWEYLSRYRIQLASDMLMRTGLSIYEIALDIGFQDQAYFCRVFKKIKGFPPGKLRQRREENG